MMDKEELMEEDHEHLSYEAIANYIVKKQFPAGLTKDRKSSLRRKCSKFRVKDDNLLYYVGNVPGKKGEKTEKLVIKDRQEQLRLVRDSHITDNGTHLGRDKTFYRVIQKFYWKGQHNDITSHVRNCKDCKEKTMNVKAPKMEVTPPKPEESTSLVSGVWQTVEVEIIGPLKETVRGRRFIITAVDCFSKWPEALPLRDKGTTDTVRFLYSLVCRYGLCEFHFHDKGKKFVNHIHKELADKLKIKQNQLSVFQVEGGNEDRKSNRTLKASLQNVVDEHQEMWDGFVDTCLFSIRNTRDPRTNSTPFTLLYHREARLPVLEMKYLAPKTDTNESQQAMEQSTFTVPNTNDLSLIDNATANNTPTPNAILLSPNASIPLHVNQPDAVQAQRTIVIATSNGTGPLLSHNVPCQTQGAIVIALENSQAVQELHNNLNQS